MKNKSSALVDLLTTSIKTSFKTSRAHLDEDVVICNIQKLIYSGADLIGVELKNDVIIIKGLSVGSVVGKPICGVVSSEFNLQSLAGLNFNGVDIGVSLFTNELALIQTKQHWQRVCSVIKGNDELLRATTTSSGTLFFTSGYDLISLSVLSVMNKVSRSSDAYLSMSKGGWACSYSGGVFECESIEQMIEFVGSMSFKVVSVINVNYVTSSQLSYELSRIGVLVYASVVSQSTVHLFHHHLVDYTCGEISQFLIGIFGAVELPVFDAVGLMKIPFSESYAFDYFNRLDASPMPEDEVLIIGDMAKSKASVLLSDFLKKPHNPSAYMDSTYTVLDVYSALRLSKWESILDKSMSLIKGNKTGLDTVDKFIGKI